MPLWGTSADAITNRPKWCPTDENSAYNRGDVYATQSGWVRKAGTAASGCGNPDAQEEVLGQRQDQKHQVQQEEQRAEALHERGFRRGSRSRRGPEQGRGPTERPQEAASQFGPRGRRPRFRGRQEAQVRSQIKHCQ